MRNEKRFDMDRFKNLSSIFETFDQGNQQFGTSANLDLTLLCRNKAYKPKFLV